MKTQIRSSLAFIVLLAALQAHGQNAYWTNSAGGDWNTASNWDVNAPPNVGTNADIGSLAGGAVTYNAPMAAPSFATLNLATGSSLDVNAAGFTLDGGGGTGAAITLGGPLNVNAAGELTTTNGGPVTIAADGVLNVSGSALLNAATDTATNAPLAWTGAGFVNVNAGGTLTVSNSGRIAITTGSGLSVNGGTFIMTNNAPGESGINLGLNGNNSGAGFTNSGGTIILDQRFESRGRFTRVVMNGGSVALGQGTNGIFEGSNDQERPWYIDGGTANLGDFVISRTTTGTGGGLVVSNGTVTLSSLRLGTGASRAGAYIGGGVVTNTGLFTIGDRTNAATSGERRVQFQVRGGALVSTAPEGIILANQANLLTNLVTATVMGSILDINAGSVTAEKVTLIRDNTLTNAHATLLLSGTGSLYLGAGGLVGNVGPINTTYTFTMSGGILGAKDDTSIDANMTLSGTTATFQAADSGGAPFNIAQNGIISGSGVLTKTGTGTLTLNTNNTYSGNTAINAGTLVLGPNGSVSNTPQIAIGSGATLNVSAVASGFSLSSGKSITGFGTVIGNVSAASGSMLNPGSNTVTGTLTFANGVVQQGGVVNHLELSANAAGADNDLIVINGDLAASGLNTIEIAGSISAGSVYPLIQYGTFNGALDNFSLSGAAGSLSNSPVTKTIYLIAQSSIRPATSITWVGNPSVNDWDLANRTNWSNGGVLDYFVTDDTVRFDATGAANPLVNVVGNVAPHEVTVDAAANYAFSGSGNISGVGALVKTNSGTLTVATTNSFSGPTILGGGWLEATTIRNSSIASSLGAATIDPANLQFRGGSLRYTGSANSSSDRGAALSSTGVIDVSTPTTLSLSGVLEGDGGLTKLGPGTLTLSGANSYAGVTTVSNGTLQINSAVTALGTNAVNLAGGTLFLNVGGQPTYSFALNLLSSSGINVAGNNTIFLANNWSGSDTLNVNINAGGVFTINSGISSNFTGTIAFGASAGLARFNAGGNSSGEQQATGSSNVVFDLGSGTVALVNRNGGGQSFGTYYLGGLAGDSGTQLRGSENSGSPSTYQVGDRNLNTTFAGSIRNGLGGTAATVSLFKVGTGTLTLSGTNTYSGSTTISSGVLAISGDGTISNTTAIHLVPGAILESFGRSDGTLTLQTNQTFDGSGTIRGSLSVGGGATLSPGDATFAFDSQYARLVVTNGFSVQSDGTLTMDVDLVTPTNDMITAKSIVYGGTLNIQGSGFTLGSVVPLFNASSYSGAFQAINPPSPDFDPSLAWDISRLTVDGTLRVMVPVAPVPTINSVVRSGADLILSGVNGAASAAFEVLTSTNLVAPLVEWTVVDSGNFGPDGSFNVTLSNTVTPDVPRRFYLLRQVSP